MSDPLVLYELKPPAAVLTLNRPDRRNALSRELIASIREAFERARDDLAARCVILTGAGPAFCAGLDLQELSDWVEQGGPQATSWDDALVLGSLYQFIYTLPKPTIAAVNGAAIAGGAGLVSVCDLAIAVDKARFGYPEVRRGLVAAIVMPHLLRHVGERMARYLLLAGELISAAEAMRSGLINEVVSSKDLMSRAEQWARATAEGGPQALTGTKALLERFSRQALSVAETAQASAAPRLGDECKAGLRAFFAKQPVPWAPPSQ
jgi:methylglutaconyl-CoA hydratase